MSIPSWPLAQLPARCAAGESGAAFGAAKRIDPYFDGLWMMGSSATWTSLSNFRKLESSGLARAPRGQFAVDTEQALIDLDKLNSWESILRILASLSTYRTMTAQQLAFTSGVEIVGNGSSRLMSRLFSLGLIDLGEYQHPFATPMSKRGGVRMYRPSATRAFAKHIEPRMTYEEWVSVTMGRGWDTSGQHDRHNVLTTEATLRALEYLPSIAASLGERNSGAGLLAYESVGQPAPSQADRAAADATWVRNDGMKIAIELTAYSSDRLKAKVARWASILASRRYDDTGLVLVFLLAPHADKIGGTASRNTRGYLIKQLHAALAMYRGVDFDPTRHRIYVADWETWFPSGHAASRSFLRLDADRVTASGEWETVSLLDESVLPTPKNPMLREGLHNFSGLRHTPTWLQSSLGEPEPMLDVARARTLIPTGEPFVADPRGIANRQLPERLTPCGDRGTVSLPVRATALEHTA